MAKVKDSQPKAPIKRPRPALTPEARENQLISLAVDLAEQQLLDGTASSQVITHYLKLGTSRERLEQKRIEQEIELQKAKTKAYASADEIKIMYSKALKAMQRYSGQDDMNDEDPDL